MCRSQPLEKLENGSKHKSGAIKSVNKKKNVESDNIARTCTIFNDFEIVQPNAHSHTYLDPRILCNYPYGLLK